MTDFAIFRFEKVKTLSELGRRSGHNNRTSSQGLEHTDPQVGVSLLLGEDDAVSAWHAKAEAVGLDQAKLRKDATHAIEWFASASPSWWTNATDDEKAEWRDITLAYIVEKAGGAKNILSAHLHEDESTPHIQALTIPLKRKQVAKRGKVKKGAERPTETVWTLTARDYIGGHRDEAIKAQTEYAATVSHLGIQRGIPRKETGARNMPPAKWRALKARELDTARAATNATIAQFEAANNAHREAREIRKDAVLDAREIRAEALEQGRAIITAAKERAYHYLEEWKEATETAKRYARNLGIQIQEKAITQPPAEQRRARAAEAAQVAPATPQPQRIRKKRWEAER